MRSDRLVSLVLLPHLPSRVASTLLLWLRAQLIQMTAMGTMVGIGLWIVGVPLAFPLAVLTFLLAFIPFVGATLAGTLAALGADAAVFSAHKMLGPYGLGVLAARPGLLAALGAMTFGSLLAAIVFQWLPLRCRVNPGLKFAHLIELSGGGTHLSLGSLLLWAAAQRH